MQYYSTNGQTPEVSLQEAVVKGLAADKGLFMPKQIKRLPESFFDNIQNLSFQEIAFEVAKAFFGEDVEEAALKQIVYDTLSFDVPLVNVNDNIYSLELFHGPTLAFKDVGARFMSRLLGYFIRKQGQKQVNVLVATSGDTGSAVANGFLGVEGIHVYVLYPKGKVSKIQECQFTTLGQNITALEIDGVFDDCQALVKSAFMDADLNKHMNLTSANSINVARFLPQAFYYFYAYAQLKKMGKDKNVVICVPSGNFGNITAGLFGKRMGLPVSRFIAANNRNDIFYQYLLTGEYNPRPSVQTIANAMDVGAPSNFARILDLYKNSHKDICGDISGCTYNDDQIRSTIKQVFDNYKYLLDPHGAVGYQAVADGLKPEEVGVFLETAHPAKFKDTVEPIVGPIEIPAKLQAFMRGEKKSIELPKDFSAFKQYLLGEVSYDIEEIEGVGEKYAEKLIAVGIKTVEELLENCAKKSGRSKLAEETGISEKLILTWTNHADLMRINGVGGLFAELLEAAGVDTIKEFRNRVAANLQPKLEEVNEQKHICGRVPTLSEVERMVEQAKKLEIKVTY